MLVNNPALGNGWGPAVIDSDEELAAIREDQKELEFIDNYWIGGSTDERSGRIIQIADYNNTALGNY